MRKNRLRGGFEVQGNEELGVGYGARVFISISDAAKRKTMCGGEFPTCEEQKCKV